MSTAVLSTPTPASLRSPARKLAGFFCLLVIAFVGLALAFPSHALDLVAFTGITGPLTSALTQIADLGPGIKALVGFVGFNQQLNLVEDRFDRAGDGVVRPGRANKLDPIGGRVDHHGRPVLRDRKGQVAIDLVQPLRDERNTRGAGIVAEEGRKLRLLTTERVDSLCDGRGVEVDLNRGEIVWYSGRGRARLTLGQSQALPFRAGAFASVVSIFPAPYITESATVGEVDRVLTPGGRFVVVDHAVLLGRTPYHLIVNLAYRLTSRPLEASKLPTQLAARGYRVQHVAHDMRRARVTALVAEKPL